MGKSVGEKKSGGKKKWAKKKSQKSWKKSWGEKKVGVKKMSSKSLKKSGGKINKKKSSKKLKKKRWKKKCGKKKLEKKISKKLNKWGSCLWALVRASEVLFGLALKCPWNGTEFVLIMFRIFKWVVFPYDFWKKINSFRILLGTSWYVFKPLLSVF